MVCSELMFAGISVYVMLVDFMRFTAVRRREPGVLGGFNCEKLFEAYVSNA